jgi:hypothetical protein
MSEKTVTWNEWAKYVNETLTQLEEDIKHIRQNMVIRDQLSYQIERIDKLRDDIIREWFYEKMQDRVKRVLTGKKLTETQLITQCVHDKSEIDWPTFWRVFKDGQKLGVIQRISRGRGKASLYTISVVPEESKEVKG